MSDKEKVTSASGATSSKLEAYDQLPYFAMRRLAQRFKLGEAKHGRDNWRKGLQDKPYVIERLGHVIHHTLKAIAILEGRIEDDGDDNAGAIMWGGAFLAEALESLLVKQCTREAAHDGPCNGLPTKSCDIFRL